MIGAGLGLASVVVIAVLLFRSLIRLNFSRFFQVTSIILVLFAAGLVAHGVHEFNEAGLIPAIVEHLWDINHILDEKSTLGELFKTLLGYNGNPSLTEVISYSFVLLLSIGQSVQISEHRKRTCPPIRRLFNEKIYFVWPDPDLCHGCLLCDFSAG